MNIVGIQLITVAVLAGIDVVMYLVLSVVDRHWEKGFEKEEDKNNESSDSLWTIVNKVDRRREKNQKRSSN